MPVDAKDLRIGNWVRFNLSTSFNTVSVISDNRIHLAGNGIWNRPDQLSGIPISSDILEASGFKYQNLAEVSPYETWDIKGIAIWEFEKGDWIVEVGNIELDYKGWMLHDIQNLYFSLYKEELNITFP